MKSLQPLVLLTGLLLAGSAAETNAQSKPAEQKKAAPEKTTAAPTTVPGVFEAVEASELSAGTEQLKSLVIRKIVPHGTVVSEGQVVVWFETEDVDEKLKDAEAALRLAELTMREDEFNFEQFLAIQELDKAASIRIRRNARQEHDNFVRVDRERQIANAEFNLTLSQASLANAVEELQQLEQMYKEDELTEESEEIVLKRARQSVESARFRLKGTEIQSDRTLKQTIPRSDETQEDVLARAELVYEKSRHTLQVARQRQDIEMDRKREKFQKQQDDLAELQSERKKLVIRARHAGIVYHGKITRGKIGDKPSTLDEGSTVTSKQILATVTRTDELQIRADLPEKERHRLQVGARCKVIPTAFPKRNLNARVKSIALVPFANGKFDCVLSLTPGDGTSGIVPAMGCTIELPNDDH